MPPAASIVTRRRRRAVALGAAAIACGTLAAAAVHHTVEEVESRTGPLVAVVVAAEEIPPGVRLGQALARRALTMREVPARYAPRDSLTSPREAIGLEPAVPVQVGAYLTAGMLRDPRARPRPTTPIHRGERLVEVAVTGGRELAGAVPARVDVLVTTERRTGGGRTFVALEDVEVVYARPARRSDTTDAAVTPADTVATLRVDARAAVFLTAAQNFARELRLLARPAGDRSRIGRAAVGDRRL